MKFNENLRKFVFFLKDKFTGNNIKRHLDDLSKTIDHKKIEQNIFNLLEYAQKNTMFYNGMISSNGIESYPIINKTVIKKNEEDFLSKRFKREVFFSLDLVSR